MIDDGSYEQKAPSHRHISFISTVQERLDEDHEHYPYLVQIQSWAGRRKVY
jgi:hypothetical protein